METDDIALTTTLVTDSCDRLLLYTLDTDDDMIHDATIVNDDGQGSPDLAGSSATEGGASVVGGLEVGVGVGGSRLPPHPKPPAHNNTAKIQDLLQGLLQLTSPVIFYKPITGW